MELYSIPASIILAQGALESSWGTSKLALKGNNHFGIKCHDWSGDRLYHDDDKRGECFRKYGRVQESFRDHSLFLSSRSRYSTLFKLSPTDYQGWAKGLQEAGYATNPNYSKLLIELIEHYQLYKYDTHKASLQRVAESTSNQKIELQRTIYTNNGVSYIVATRYDSFGSLANEYSLFKREIYRFNDLPKGASIHENMILYIQRKKRRAPKGVKWHRVEKGSTLWDISQLYAIRFKTLLKLNSFKEDRDLIEGEVIKVNR